MGILVRMFKAKMSYTGTRTAIARYNAHMYLSVAKMIDITIGKTPLFV